MKEWCAHRRICACVGKSLGMFCYHAGLSDNWKEIRSCIASAIDAVAGEILSNLFLRPTLSTNMRFS